MSAFNHLNLPFDELLPAGSNILVAGMGGGFDVFCGLPIYFELVRRGYSVHLASLSFSPLSEYTDCSWLSPTLVGVNSAPAGMSGYHPERYLARWFQEHQHQDVTIWCFEASGAAPMAED